jgi:hypothetical protein
VFHLLFPSYRSLAVQAWGVAQLDIAAVTTLSVQHQHTMVMCVGHDLEPLEAFQQQMYDNYLEQCAEDLHHQIIREEMRRTDDKTVPTSDETPRRRPLASVVAVPTWAAASRTLLTVLQTHEPQHQELIEQSEARFRRWRDSREPVLATLQGFGLSVPQAERLLDQCGSPWAALTRLCGIRTQEPTDSGNDVRENPRQDTDGAPHLAQDA